MNESIHSYGFGFLDSTQSSIIRLHGVGHEHRRSDYCWDNAARGADAWLFQYTLSGRGSATVNGATGDLPAGSAFLLRLPGPSRYFLPAHAKEGWQFIWIMFGGAAADGYAREVVQHAGPILRLPGDAPSISFLRLMIQRAQAGEIESGFVAEEMTFRFACKLCADTLRPRQDTGSLVSRATELMERDFADLGGVTELANRLRVSPEHLSRLYRDQTGSTLKEAFLRVRIRHAAQLLIGSQMSIDEVARKSGFSGGNYFAKAFGRAVGVPPGRFRREARELQYSDVML